MATIMKTELVLVTGSYTTGRMVLEITYPDASPITWAQFALEGQSRLSQTTMGCINDFQFTPDGEERSTLSAIKEAAMDWAGRALVPDEQRLAMAAGWSTPVAVL